MGPARGGNFVQDGGGVSVRIRVFRLRFGCIWNLGFFWGLETRNFHPGGSGRGGGGLRVKDGSTGGPEGGREGCMWGGKNGLSLSLLLVSYSPPSLMCSAAPAVGLLTHSLRVTQAGV